MLLEFSQKLLTYRGNGKLASETFLLQKVIEEEKYVEKIIRKLKAKNKKLQLSKKNR